MMRRAFHTLIHYTKFPHEKWVSMETSWGVRRGNRIIEVSDHGRVRDHVKRVIYKPYLKDRYMHVCYGRLHRLVAMAFLPNPDDLPTVNHKDHDPSNNHVDNLEWASYAYQNNHRRKPSRAVQRLVSARRVIGTNTVSGITHPFDTIEDAAQFVIRHGLTKSTTTNCVKTKISAVALKRSTWHKKKSNGKQYVRLSAFGFSWKYVEPGEIDGEIWKPLDPALINGINGYSISSEGRICNRTGRVTRGTNRGSDYTAVTVSTKFYLLHILVAKTFLPPPLPGQTQVNHKDKIRTNARASNLEWVTPSQNVLHRFGHEIYTVP